MERLLQSKKKSKLSIYAQLLSFNLNSALSNLVPEVGACAATIVCDSAYATIILKEVACVTLRNIHKQNKRSKGERSFAHLLFLIIKLLLGCGLDFEFGLGLALSLDLGLELGSGVGLG